MERRKEAKISPLGPSAVTRDQLVREAPLPSEAQRGAENQTEITPEHVERADRKKRGGTGNELGETLISQYIDHSPDEEEAKSSSREVPVIESVLPPEEVKEEVFETLNHSEMIALQQRRQEELAKPIYFNVIVVGESGVGKSTFIDAFLSRHFNRDEASVIRPTTEAINEKIGVRSWGSTKLIMKLVDTPGYSQKRPPKECYRLVRNYLIDCYGAYQERYETSRRGRPIEDQDTRIHVCLYFLTGPRIKQEDILMMRRLQSYVSIIPVLAKGDTYTPEEIRQIKLDLIADARDHHVDWFDCASAVGPEKSGTLQDGPFGPSPPFVVVSAVEKVPIAPNQFVIGRKYRWGVCSLENPDHSDFMLLYSLLIGHFSLACIRKAAMYTSALKRRLEKRPNSTPSFNTAHFGSILTLGALSLGVLWLKEKLSK
eukprot:TRINITY_DN8678_c0_g1_i1.p1 TRINITY_DN8678_c0_g1~~TRINITY_DN8678_c0_g1_i1.p1  ORF type:complete len:429 (-),score=54.31 TRINITY_DN8678_c0_g1_i1:163-1449(-)